MESFNNLYSNYSSDRTLNISGNSSDGLEEEYYWYYYYWFDFGDIPASLLIARDVFDIYIRTALMLLALPNILVVVILLKKENRTFSMSAYLVSLSVADLIVIFKSWITLKNNFQPITTVQECYLQSIMMVGGYVSPWTQAIISLERTLCIIRPHKIKLICTFQVARKLIALTWTIALGIAIFNLLVNEYAEKNFSACIIKEAYLAVYNVIVWFLYFSVLPLPVAIIFISSCVIVLSLSLRKRFTESQSAKLAERRVTIIVLILNGIYIACNTPYVLHHALYILNQGEDFLYHASISMILRTLQLVNHTSNFYVYFLAGSKFRQETKALFMKLRICK